MRVCWPDFYLENLRQGPHYGQSLADELAKLGVYCYRHWTGRADLVFCGSIFRMNETKAILSGKNVPLVNYSWDVYPWQLEGERSQQGKDTWQKYLEFLKDSALVLVPSRCQVKRHRQYVSVGLHVKPCLCSIKPIRRRWVNESGPYTVDVMRKYPDPGEGLVEKTCLELGLVCHHSGMNMPREQYEALITGATFLTSAYYECSTAGLSLLEAHGQGVPVLLADSPYNGGVDYFGDRATYFGWNDRVRLQERLKSMIESPPEHDPDECMDWVVKNYGEAAFARRLKAHFEEILS